MSVAELKRCFECGATYPQEVLACANDGTPLCFDTVGRRWKIEGVIGRRAGGAIFAAFHLVSGQYAAIDMLPGQSARQASAATRFNQQLQALRILDQNKSILRLIEEGTERDGSRFMVTELGELRPLQDLIEEWRRPLGVLMEPGEAALLVRPLLSLLSTAARLGMAHGSLDATQIFVGSANDFAGGLTNVATVKLHGLAALGMGPQLREAQAADLRGLGQVLYELCTGKLPPAVELVAQEPLPPGLEGPLGQVILRAVGAPGTAPYATAEELQRALSTAALGGRPPGSSVSAQLMESARSNPGLPAPSGMSAPPQSGVSAPLSGMSAPPPSGVSAPLAGMSAPPLSAPPSSGVSAPLAGMSAPPLSAPPSSGVSLPPLSGVSAPPSSGASAPPPGTSPLAGAPSSAPPKFLRLPPPPRGPGAAAEPAAPAGAKFLSLPPAPGGPAPPRPNPPAGSLPPVRVTAQHSAVPAPLASLISGPQRSGLTSELRQVSILDLMREMNEQKEKQEAPAKEETLARSRFRPSLNNIKPMPRPDPSGRDPGPPPPAGRSGDLNAPAVSVFQGMPDSGATALEPTVVDPNNAPASPEPASAALGRAQSAGTAPNRTVAANPGTAPNRIVAQSVGTAPNRIVASSPGTAPNRIVASSPGTAPNRTVSQSVPAVSLPPTSAAADGAAVVTPGDAAAAAAVASSPDSSPPSALSRPRNSAAQAAITTTSPIISEPSPPRGSAVVSSPPAVDAPGSPAEPVVVGPALAAGPGPVAPLVTTTPAAPVARETSPWTWVAVIGPLLAIIAALVFKLLTRK